MSNRARPFVGIILYRPSDPGNAVIAPPSVLELFEPTSGDPERDRRRWDELVGEARDIALRGAPVPEAPSHIQSILRPIVGAPGPDGRTDHVLRITRPR